ncbi:MAG: pseudouridine synthase [Flavobacteriales bacterium]|nr:pseudouridine synthase [Flavobacteriales bacterium]
MSTADRKGPGKGKRPKAAGDRKPGERRPRTRKPGDDAKAQDDAWRREFRGEEPRSEEDRPRRSAPRSFDREDRPSYARGRASEDRPARPYRGRDEGGEERPRRSAPRSNDRGDRPSRPYRGREEGGEERPRRSAPRSDDRGDRPSYPRGRSSEDRTSRPYRGRTEGGEERPRRSFDRGEGRSRSGDRPQRPYGRSNDRGRSGDRPSGPPKDRREYRPDDADARKPFSKGERSQRFSLPNPDNEGLVRLNRYLAQAGVGSRREADELITSGAVTVNGKVVTELGTRIKPDDVVHFGGQKLSMEQKRYVLLNKPKDTITTTDDPRERHTVMDLIRNACTERLYPVGRLDRNTTGLILLTNDGDLAKKLTHPSHGAEKIYHATLDKNISAKDLERLAEGVHLEDGPAAADEVSYVGESKREVGIKLHMGRNRIVRRMFEALGYEVVKLDRVIFAGLTKKDLPRGHWRHLTEKELNLLRRLKEPAKASKAERGGGRLRGQQFGDE